MKVHIGAERRVGDLDRTVPDDVGGEDAGRAVTRGATAAALAPVRLRPGAGCGNAKASRLAGAGLGDGETRSRYRPSTSPGLPAPIEIGVGVDRVRARTSARQAAVSDPRPSSENELFGHIDRLDCPARFRIVGTDGGSRCACDQPRERHIGPRVELDLCTARQGSDGGARCVAVPGKSIYRRATPCSVGPAMSRSARHHLPLRWCSPENRTRSW